MRELEMYFCCVGKWGSGEVNILNIRTSPLPHTPTSALFAPESNIYVKVFLVPKAQSPKSKDEK